MKPCARFESGRDEDACVVDALVFEAEKYGFAFAVSAPIDFCAGMDGKDGDAGRKKGDFMQKSCAAAYILLETPAQPW